MIYQEKVQTRVEDFDVKGEMLPGQILRVLENIASHHSSCASDNVVDKSLHGIAWILTEWRVKIERPPCGMEPLTAKTWATGKAPASRAGREWLICDRESGVLVKASGQFALLDLKRGRPVRVTQELLEQYGPENQFVFTRELPRIQLPTAYREEKSLSLRRADVDYNGHVHNAVYLDLALEILPEKLLEQGVRAFRISYRSPLQYGDSVLLRRKDTETGCTVAFFRGETMCAAAEFA